MRRAAGCGLDVGVALVVLVTLLYVGSPLDLVPDVAPGLGQLDDVLAVLVGGGSASLLALVRLIIGSEAGRKSARRGCAVLALALLSSLMCIGGVLVALQLSAQ
ncbi:MAG: DUF1232 domain-containing protein [Anaerolineae bacterium]|nr:DUF1232 domain-containing protein [Anaerolineae bacterium]